jgi:hypothetical protein
MYERPSGPLHETTRILHNRGRTLSGSLSSIVGPTSLDSIIATLQEKERDANSLAKQNGWEYTVISELNTSSLASCGMFWKKGETWIVLAFRGTDPLEFEEWVRDFEFGSVEMHDRIDEWGTGEHFFSLRLTTTDAVGLAHAGFANKLFESKEDGGASPYC